jgi:hypothetical protein
MMTMEQSLAELVMKGTITSDVAVSRSSRPDQLLGLLERSGWTDTSLPGTVASPFSEDVAPAGGLRLAGEV